MPVAIDGGIPPAQPLSLVLYWGPALYTTCCCETYFRSAGFNLSFIRPSTAQTRYDTLAPEL